MIFFVFIKTRDYMNLSVENVNLFDYDNDIEEEIFLLNKTIQEILLDDTVELHKDEKPNFIMGISSDTKNIKDIKAEIQKQTNNDKEEFECGICYDKIEDEKVIYLKKCKHKFCKKCIRRVLGRKYKKRPCPYCRRLFSKNDIKDIKKNKKNIKKKCKCGSTTHQRTNHLSCPLNKKNK